ncbi:Serine endoprotease [Escherichia coli]|nr:Serine endoprotease [Escherichia coli]
MKKQTQLLSALALSVGLTLSASFQAVASIPGQVADQAPLPSLAPMLEKVLPAVVSVRVEGTVPVRDRKSRKNSKSFLVMIYRINLHNPSKV